MQKIVILLTANKKTNHILLTAVIVDDEARNIALFSYYLEKYCPNIKLVASFLKKSKAIDYLLSKKPDILFLDIVLDHGSGFDILDEICCDDTQVVMCTAHDEFALRAIRYQVVDYILKPIEIQDLIATVDKIDKKLKSANGKQVYDAEVLSQFNLGSRNISQRFALSDRFSIDLISVEDIICVETHKGKEKTEVMLKSHDKNEFIIANVSIQEAEKKLQSTKTFFRVSRSTLVCVTAIKSILRNVQYTIVLSNEKRIFISRKGYRELVDFIEKTFETKV